MAESQTIVLQSGPFSRTAQATQGRIGGFLLGRSIVGARRTLEGQDLDVDTISETQSTAVTAWSPTDVEE